MLGLPALVLLAPLVLAASASAADGAVRPAVGGEARAVAEVDLARYAGKWYEIARLPNRFQKRCVGDVSATYTLREDGKVDVLNVCRAGDGSTIEARGLARRADRDGPASRLKVRFAPGYLSWLPMVWADYWVLELAPDYSHALVGTPNHKYLWILARTPALDEATYERIVAVAAEQGFPINGLMRSEAGEPGEPTEPADARPAAEPSEPPPSDGA